MKFGISKGFPFPSRFFSLVGTRIRRELSLHPSSQKMPCDHSSNASSRTLASLEALKPARSWILKSSAIKTSLARRVNSTSDFWLLPDSFQVIMRQMDIFCQGQGEGSMTLRSESPGSEGWSSYILLLLLLGARRFTMLESWSVVKKESGS